ncbi:hypothetical protein KR059_000402 [Drosophila kikkawai]|nr:hypothetical protein KR059_000402 [Drosophila kikkawai]
MSKLVDVLAWLLWPLRRYHSAVAMVSLFCLLLWGVLDYAYKIHGVDLLWWHSQMTSFNIDSLSVLLYIVGAKMSLILVLALVSCIRSAVVKKEPRCKEMPISYVRRRYCRFLVMQLLFALDALVQEPETMDLADYAQRHANFVTAVQCFRWQARKMFERIEQQVLRPQHEVLHVDDLLEEELLGRGYADRLATLREWEIFRMVYGSPD